MPDVVSEVMAGFRDRMALKLNGKAGHFKAMAIARVWPICMDAAAFHNGFGTVTEVAHMYPAY